MMTSSDLSVVAGIDVSKAFLDVALRDDSLRLSRFPNTPAGQSELSVLFASAHCDLVVLEATGGYEAAAACLLQAQGHPVAVVNPRRVRAFAESMGFLAKTDKADATVLAEFAGVLIRKPDVHKFLLPIKDSSRKELEALMARRSQLISMHTAEHQRRQMAPGLVQPSIQTLLEAIEKLLDENDIDLQKIVHDRFQELDQLLQSIPGIGKATSRVLIGSLPELGHLSRRAISALVGLAPMARDSGASHGKRRIQGGRGHIRTILYMATLSAIRHNPTLKLFSQRLTSSGKPFKVVQVACMRKLITTLNAMARSNTAWQEVVTRL